MKLLTTAKFESMSYLDLAAIANGCGPANCGWCTKFLDKALGLKVFDACAQHDVDYAEGGDEAKRREDDIRFICNLIIIALMRPRLINILRVPYLFIYYFIVRWKGKAHYNYKN